MDVPRIARGTIEYVGYNDASLRIRLPHLRRAQPDPVAIARHLDGRGYGRRRRPGPDVRLRLRRNARADAAAHHDGAQAGAAPLDGAARGHPRFPAPRRQEPGQRGIRRQHARSASRPWSSPPSTARTSPSKNCARRSRSTSSTRWSRPGMVDSADQVSHQPHRPFRGRRTARRYRPDRPQDHRRHLRRHGPARRRRVLRQGPDEGGPLGLLHGALHRQEHRGRETGHAAAKCSWPTPSAWRSRYR